MAVYNGSGGIVFTITDESGRLDGEKVPSGAESIIGSGAEEPPNVIGGGTDDKKTADSAGANRATNMLMSKALAPINQATGGIATPVYNLGKSIVRGASVAGPLIGLAFAAYSLGMKIYADVQRNKEEAKTAARAERRTGMANYGKRNG